MTAERRKRVWDVGDFAAHAGIEHKAARRMLKRLDAKHGGKLLHPTDGENRRYTFAVATLVRLEPDLFAPVESLEFRLDELEERVDEIATGQRRIASQTGYNTRAIEKMRRCG